jgi:mono/diheme cytochrome c family protein
MQGFLSVVFCAAAPLAVAGQAPRAPAVQPPSHEHDSSHEQAVSGAETFRTYCASCHGADGKGEGPRAASLRFHPADLTLIASRHGGSYPTEEVYRIVDGRKPLRGHGAPDMPIWGDAVRNPETGFDEAAVRQRIRSVVDYVRTLQAGAKK